MSLNTRSIAAGDALAVLRAGWAAQADRGLMVSYMLHGRPGVGKTEIIRQLADERGARLFDLRLTTIEPQDLRGLPYFDQATRKTVWYRPEDLPDDPDQPALLFLDELTAAAPALQPAVYGLLQERRVGPHRLPDSVFVVAAGNTAEDGAVAYEMGTALSDRLVHLHIAASAKDWLENYAVPQNLNPAVIAFIKTRPDLLETTDRALQSGEMIAATPRSWTRVSDILAARPERRHRDILVSGTVGEAVAAEFALVADEIAASVQIADMMEADPTHMWALYPATMHGLNALAFGLIGGLDRDNAARSVEIMAGIRQLASKRDDPALARIPLAELCTYGFELLIQKALDQGLGEAILATSAYRDYAEERRAAGLG
ncbi:MAG: MoxR family ATPase [Pseudomonadota bacterium]